MKKEIDLTQIQKLFEKAEQIVSAVSGPQLKPVAFGKILDLLLHGTQIPNVETKGATKLSKIKRGKKVKEREGPKAWLKELKEEDFFKTPKNTNEMLTALEERGHHLKRTDLTLPLQTLVTEKQLRRKKQAPTEGERPVWHYSNW